MAYASREAAANAPVSLRGAQRRSNLGPALCAYRMTEIASSPSVPRNDTGPCLVMSQSNSWCNQIKGGKVAAVPLRISSKQWQARDSRMRPDKEVRQHTASSAASGAVA